MQLEHASTELSDWAILRKCKTNTYFLMRESRRQSKKRQTSTGSVHIDLHCMSQANAKFPAPCSFPHRFSTILYNSGLTHLENDTHFGLHSPYNEKPSSVSRAEWDWNVYLTYIYVHSGHSFEAQENDVQKEHF